MPTKPKKSDDLSTAQGENFVKAWLKNIDDAMKREKKFRESAQKVVDLYEAKESDNVPFAIVYSNTEVLAPSVYNTRPIPIVTRRFKDTDPIGKAVSEVSTRALKFVIDTEDENYDTFDELIQASVLDALVTNRGLTRFKYVAHEDREAYECVYGEAVRWDKFFHGYARTWKKVPWIGFEWDMSKEEIEKNFEGVDLDLKAMETAASESPDETAENRDELTGVVTYKVYEIWDKRTKKVMFFSGCARKAPLRRVDDPLGLTNFFPIPKPINFMKKITTLVPTPLYEQYRQQAQELNDITRRLKAIIKAIRYRGVYNAAVEGIAKMLSAEDNELVPVENVQSMPDGTGMDKLLWTVPVNELAQTAQSLYQQREQVKSVIYEITGISDILRGASVASETATAQNIKNQWGTLRLKKMQKEVMRYCRDALAIMLEIAAKKFEQKTFQQMTGLSFMTDQQKQQASMMKAAFEQQVNAAKMSGQQPPQMPQIPPEIVQAMSLPTWEQILSVMHNDVIRHYKTDIETNSTIDAEATQDKQDIADLLNALSQFLNGLGPLVESGKLPFSIAKEMLLVITRRYNFGANLEDALNSLKEPPPPQEEKDPAKEMDLQIKKLELEAKTQQTKQEMAKAHAEFQQEQQLAQMKLAIEKEELAIKQQELQMQREGMQMKLAMQRETHRLKMEGLAMQAALKNKPEAANAEV